MGCVLEPLDEPRALPATAEDKLPSQSISDWVNYAEVVVVLRVEDEEKDFAEGQDDENYHGYVGRRVETTLVQVLWEPLAGASGFRAGEALEMLALGWQFEEGVFTPLQVRGGTRLTVGRQYVVALVNFERGGWGPIGSGSPLPTDGTRIETMGCLLAQGVNNPLVGEFGGMTVCEVAAALEDFPRDPSVEQFRDLRPEMRWEAVIGAANPGE